MLIRSPSGVSVRMRSQDCATCCEWVTISALGLLARDPFEQQRQHLAGGARIEVAGRLVGEDQRRAVHQRARDRHPLQLAARQRSRPARPKPARPTRSSSACVRGACSPAGTPPSSSGTRDVLRHGQRRQHVKGLEDEADAARAQRCPRRFVEADDVQRLRADARSSRCRRFRVRRCS
jgi:hypothetical protein